MAELYKPISRKEVLTALVNKFGAVETLRYYLGDALSDLQSMEVGLGENNQMLAAKNCGSLRESLDNIRILLDEKNNRGGVEKTIKENLK